MTISGLPAMAIVADDLTGAMDTGAQFASAGLRTFLDFALQPRQDVKVLVVNTRSRNAKPAQAIRWLKTVLPLLSDRYVFKKIDSTLRGHIALESEILLKHLNLQTAVVCPAIPALGREVRDGALWVGENELHTTDIGRDPTWPIHTSDILGLLGDSGEKIPLEVVRSARLEEAVLESRASLLVPDARTDEDLNRIASAAVAANCLPCGALAFARAWLLAMAGGDFAEPCPIQPTLSRPLLFVIGSCNPRARRQIAALSHGHRIPRQEIFGVDDMRYRFQLRKVKDTIAAGRSVILSSPDVPIDSSEGIQAARAQLASSVKQLVSEMHIGALIISGGDTAEAILENLDLSGISIQGELSAGLPYGRLHGRDADGLAIITKAGDFGDDQIWVDLVGGTMVEQNDG